MSYEAPVCELEIMADPVSSSKDPSPDRWESDVDKG